MEIGAHEFSPKQLRDDPGKVIPRLIRSWVGHVSKGPFPVSLSGPVFGEPLIGIVSVNDMIFGQYKEIIGPFHLIPQEILAAEVARIRPQVRSDDPLLCVDQGSVISWVLPVAPEIVEANARCSEFPAAAWACQREYGEHINSSLERYLVSLLELAGFIAVAPVLSPVFQRLDDFRVGLASSWSERHVAYAAGLGTFGLSDAFISDAGCAVVCGSIVTSATIPPTVKTRKGYKDHCLWYSNGSCGVCIDRCPIGAVKPECHDKAACASHIYGTVIAHKSREYGVSRTGCGLCVTGVPCATGAP